MTRSSDIEYKVFFNKVVGREEVQLLSDAELQKFFGKSRILIIGAGGSIGSALAKRLIFAKIMNVFFLDHDESSLHALALELSGIGASSSNNFFVGDIRDYQSIKDVVSHVMPTIVVHAAALKHLAILERFPREGFLTNIIGTLNVAEICVEHNVEQFVNISTDKAANAISVLGKTKKLGELITEEIFTNTGLNYCSVRFGNVFSSRGSVIETFIHQIRHQIPVTLTDKRVARFFMSRNESANLVLAATSLKESGTFIQNMGEEVMILDVINRIAEYLNLKATIKIVGLKNGEKMHEELFDGPVLPTRFEPISRSVHSFRNGLVKEIKQFLPKNNIEALEQIENLTLTYLKTV